MGALALLAALWPLVIGGLRDRRGLVPGAAVSLAHRGRRRDARPAPVPAPRPRRSTGRTGTSSASAGAGHTVVARVELRLRRHRLPARQDHRAPDQGAAPRPLLAGDDARHLRLGSLGRDALRDRRRRPATQYAPAPTRSSRRRGVASTDWVKQEVDVRALVDDHVIAAGQPMELAGSRDTAHPLPQRRRHADARRVSPTCAATRSGATRRDRSPASLVRSPPAYPELAGALSRRRPHDRAALRRSGPGGAVSPHLPRRPLPAAVGRTSRCGARRSRLTAKARSPYEATVTIERWLRSDGGFRYDEHPPRSGPAAAARRLPRADEARLLPAVRGVDGTDAALPRHPRPRRGRVHERNVEGRHVDRHRPRCACLGRGVVRRATAGSRSTRRPAAARSRRRTRTPPTRPTRSGRSAPARFLGAGFVRAATPAGVWRRRWRPTRRRHPVAADRPVRRSSPPRCSLLALVKSSRRYRRARTSDPRRRASAARAELAAFVRDQGSEVSASASVDELALELRRLGVGSDAFAAAFSRARYGPPAGAARAADETRKELRRVISLLRDRLGPGRRVRGFLTVRSLRSG